MRIAGLSIEWLKVKASFISKGFGAPRFLGTDEVTLPPGDEARDEALVQALTAWKKKHGLTGLTVGLGLINFSSHTVKLPVRTRADVAQALKFEMEKYLPLQPDQYVFDFCTVEATSEGSTNIVLAVRKERLKWISDCTAAAGLRLLAIRCNALEAATELLGSVNVIEALLIRPDDGAYELIGIRNATAVLLRHAASPQEALSEARKLAGSFGGVLYVAGAEKHLNDFKELNARSFALQSASLIAQSASRKGRLSLDFVPAELVAARTDYYPYVIAAMCAAALLLFFMTSTLSYYKDYRALRLVNLKITKIKNSTKGLIETRNKTDTALEKVRFLKDFQEKKNRKIKIISELSDLMPRDAWLIGLSADEKGKVTIEGYARRTASVIEPLEKSPLFSDVEFTSPVTVREGKERFSLSMRVEQ